MIKNYKNSQALLNSNTPNSGEWLDNNDLELLKSHIFTSSIDISSINPTIEFHVHDLSGGYIAGNHLVDKLTVNDNNIQFDVHRNIRDLGLTRGEFKFNYNNCSNNYSFVCLAYL